MRIFIAIPVSEKLQNEVLKYRELYPDLAARWLEGKNLHITLIPPWEEENIEKVKIILKPLENKFGRFEMEFNSVSFGPNDYNPRLIWATGKAPKEIIKLKKSLEELLRMPSERDSFLLHLTIARFNPSEFKHFPIKKINDEINWKDAAKEFAIMRSRLSRSGADYEILEKFNL